ncbi:MAG: thioredoxin domain-containing protein [Proteobacteria bacterium]|nr:thioredoxin domain-containing protein [Pseudomonadota bacterium]
MKSFPFFRRMIPALMAGLLLAAQALPAQAQNHSPLLAQSPSDLQSKAPALSLSPAEKRSFEDLIRDFILKNPEIIIESIQNLQARDKRDAQARSKANLVKFRGEIFNDPATPVGGNVKGDVTIVEFFDYRCGFCKRVFPAVMKVLNDDGNIRYVYKEFPILGADSLTASKAALAAWLTDKGKYEPFHRAMMVTKGALPEQRVMKIAAQTGYDVKALKKTMADPRIDEMIKKNFALAEALDINGTPAFVIGDKIVRGAIDLAALKKLISQARGS